MLEVNKLSRVLRWSLEGIFILGIAIIAGLPYIIKNFFLEYFSVEHEISRGLNLPFYNFCLVLLILCGLCALYILRVLISIMKTIDGGNPFVIGNVVALRKISFGCFFFMAMFALKCVLFPTFLTFAITFIFILAGFLAIVFSELFRQAVNYKTENDLTI